MLFNEEQRDLGVPVHKSLKMAIQVEKAVNRTQGTLFSTGKNKEVIRYLLKAKAHPGEPTLGTF